VKEERDMSNETKTTGSKKDMRLLMVGIVIALAFVGSYAYASTKSATTGTDVAVTAGAPSGVAAVPGAKNAAAGTQGAAGAQGAGGAGCACCGGASGPQETVKGSTTVSGAVQKVTVDLTTGTYSPNEITAKAGVPIEITFKGPASSCNGSIISSDLGIAQTDVSNGGVVNVPALKAGTYKWTCSMQMYTATIVVK
jgi:hypothetical protein